MKKFLLNTFIISLIIVGVVFVQHRYFPTTIIKHEQTIKIDTTWIHDTVTIKLKPDKPIIIDTIIAPEYDTTKCDSLYKDLYLKYYSKYLAQATIYKDSNLVVKLKDTITQNQVTSREISIEKNFPTITKTITNTNTVYANSIYLGGTFSSKEITPTVVYSTKKFSILAGYNITYNTPVIGAYININKIIKW